MNFFEFLKKFPTELACIKHFIEVRYKGNIECHHCKSKQVYHRDDFPKMFQCASCGNSFSIFKNTIFEHSPTDLRKWFYAIHLFLNGKKGISALQLKREISVTYKCAWRMLHKIREAMSDNNDNNQDGMLKGFVEMDECYIGGKHENMHASKKQKAKAKAVVFGMVERDGRVKAFHVKSSKTYDLQPSIYANVQEGSVVLTDESKSYHVLHWNYKHHAVNHSKKEYVKSKKVKFNNEKAELLKIHTNTIEGFWGTLKRGVYGIYHHVSEKYLQNYVNEFCFRYNNRKNAGMFDLVLEGAIL